MLPCPSTSRTAASTALSNPSIHPPRGWGRASVKRPKWDPGILEIGSFMWNIQVIHGGCDFWDTSQRLLSWHGSWCSCFPFASFRNSDKAIPSSSWCLSGELFALAAFSAVLPRLNQPTNIHIMEFFTQPLARTSCCWKVAICTRFGLIQSGFLQILGSLCFFLGFRFLLQLLRRFLLFLFALVIFGAWLRPSDFLLLVVLNPTRGPGAKMIQKALNNRKNEGQKVDHFKRPTQNMPKHHSWLLHPGFNFCSGLHGFRLVTCPPSAILNS